MSELGHGWFNVVYRFRRRGGHDHRARTVGKMTVGHEIAPRAGLRLFHNHVSIEPVLRYFDFGSPQFSRLVGEFRGRLIEEVAASDLAGLVFTYVCAFDDPRDQQVLDLRRARRSGCGVTRAHSAWPRSRPSATSRLLGAICGRATATPQLDR